MKGIIFVQLVFIVLILAFCSPSFAVDSDSQNNHASAQLTDHLSKVTSFKAGFKQWVNDYNGSPTADSEGKIWVKRPGRFKVETVDQEVISNGKTLWVYDIDLAQVTAYNLSESIGDIPALLLSGSSEIIAGSYNVTAVYSRTMQQWQYRLTKKTGADGHFELLMITFSGFNIISMYLQDDLGQSLRLEFFDIEQNISIDDQVFNFSPPENVDVIGDNGN